MTFPQKMNHLVGSNALSTPRSGPHQSSTSAEPVRAWQMTRQLSPRGLSLPQVLYATGTSWSVTPDSSVKEGMVVMD